MPPLGRSSIKQNMMKFAMISLALLVFLVSLAAGDEHNHMVRVGGVAISGSIP